MAPPGVINLRLQSGKCAASSVSCVGPLFKSNSRKYFLDRLQFPICLKLAGSQLTMGGKNNESCFAIWFLPLLHSFLSVFFTLNRAPLSHLITFFFSFS